MLLARLPDDRPEIFATVQGEGVSAGVPSVFVRLADCNLRCGFCDTRYTWDWEAHDRAKETVELPIEDILSRVREVSGNGVRTAVFTGGEPLLQQDELATLARALVDEGYRIEVETNGTIAPAEALAACVAQWNVSPKLESSGNALRARKRSSALAWFASRESASFKFVLVSEADVREVQELAAELGLPASRVVLMPEGTEPATLAERSRWLAGQCQTYGYRLGARLHVFVWGPERGR